MSEGTKPPFQPLILGIVTARMLREHRYPDTLWKCDGVELRADGLPVENVISDLESFSVEKKGRGFTGPVVLTLRLCRDGGAWDDAAADQREFLWREIAGHVQPICDIVDIEIEEVLIKDSQAWRVTDETRVKRMLSHHSFVPEDPSIWENDLAAMRSFHPDAVKFALTVRNSEDVLALLRFSRKVAKEFPLSCVIGMGVAGRTTRVLSPLLGCPITYAYLEDGPVAPGQLHVEVLRAFFARVDEGPSPGATEEEWILWAERILREPVPGAEF